MAGRYIASFHYIRLNSFIELALPNPRNTLAVLALERSDTTTTDSDSLSESHFSLTEDFLLFEM